jgi:hypothetical protein
LCGLNGTEIVADVKCCHLWGDLPFQVVEINLQIFGYIIKNNVLGWKTVADRFTNKFGQKNSLILIKRDMTKSASPTVKKLTIIRLQIMKEVIG